MKWRKSVRIIRHITNIYIYVCGLGECEYIGIVRNVCLLDQQQNQTDLDFFRIDPFIMLLSSQHRESAARIRQSVCVVSSFITHSHTHTNFFFSYFARYLTLFSSAHRSFLLYLLLLHIFIFIVVGVRHEPRFVQLRAVSSMCDDVCVCVCVYAYAYGNIFL